MINKCKKGIALFLCLFILLPSLKEVLPVIVSFLPFYSNNIVYADDYKEQSKDDDTGVSYYLVENSKNFEALFDFNLGNISNIIEWVFEFKTYTVIAKNVGDNDYTIYFNAPNLQSIVKNDVISSISDGYTDETYNVNETEWIVDVGTTINGKAPTKAHDNVIYKYGFQIPNYIYEGEYPRATMSVANIIPVKWYKALWNFVRSLLGFSFLDAPDAKSFKTITYYNNQYEDKNFWVLDFFKQYYIKYFVDVIPEVHIEGDKEYFNDPNHFNELYVDKKEKDNALSWKIKYAQSYAMAIASKNLWTAINDSKQNATIKLEDSTGTNTAHISNENNIYEIIANDETYNPRVEDNQIPALVADQTFNNEVFSLPMVFIRKLQGGGAIDDYKAKVNNFMQTEVCRKCFGTEIDAVEDITMALDVQKTMHDMIVNPMIYYEYTTDDGSTESAQCFYTDYVASNTSDYTITNIEVNGQSLSMTEYLTLVNQMQLMSNYDWVEAQFLTIEDKNTIAQWEANTETITRYLKFEELFNKGDEVSFFSKEIPYRQCLIASKSDNECYNDKYNNERISLSVGSVYARGHLYEEIDLDKYKTNKELSTNDAIKVIQKLQAICGPYYSEVLRNMVVLMCFMGFSNDDRSPFEDCMGLKQSRMMPYDTDTMIPEDKVNYSTKDPRVTLYKSHFIGALVSDFELKFGFGVFFKPQKLLINLGGRITEISVLFQQLISFQWLEDRGLSPSSMWISAYTLFLFAAVALFFIIKTVISIFKMGSRAGSKILVGFLLFFMELGILTAISLDPEGAWGKIRNIINSVMTLGEKMSPPANDKNTAYLFEGNNEAEILYYLPYLDMWTKFNVGYDLADNENYFDIDDYFKNKDKYPELKDIEIDENSKETKLPKLKGKDVKNYSVVLIDAFSYYGYTTSLLDSVVVNHNTDQYIPAGVTMTVNGEVINNNAYRVVDHFMAPRISITEKSDNTLALSAVKNENYNGEFQTGIVDMIVKLLCCLLGCLLSLIKFLTFLWFWWVLYIFIFRVMLGKAAEHKTMSHILAETFGPLLMIVFIGLYSGMALTLGMSVHGLIGLVVLIVLFKITFRLIPVWQQTANGLLFPLLLVPIANMVNSVVRKKENAQYQMDGDNDEHAYTDAQQNEVRDRFSNEIMEESRKHGDLFHTFDDSNETFSDIDAFTSLLFDEETLAMKYPNCHWIYIRWLQFYKKENKWNNNTSREFNRRCYELHHVTIEDWERDEHIPDYDLDVRNNSKYKKKQEKQRNYIDDKLNKAERKYKRKNKKHKS